MFKVGGSEGEEYIPCEGVWAAGEVKSRLRRKEIRSICEHSMSVRRLRRYAQRGTSILTGEETVSFRSYGVGMALEGTKEEEYDQDKKNQTVYLHSESSGHGKSATPIVQRKLGPS